MNIMATGEVPTIWQVQLRQSLSRYLELIRELSSDDRDAIENTFRVVTIWRAEKYREAGLDLLIGPLGF